MKEITKIDVLGTPYTIFISSMIEDKKLESMDGYTDSTVKDIVVFDLKDCAEDVTAKKDLKAYHTQVLRHEIIHAFFEESGLSNSCVWECEQIVDWFAIQFPKIEKVFNEIKNIFKEEEK